MKVRVGVVTILIAVAACSGDDGDSAEPAERFRVLTYNVAGLPQEISSENPREHLPLISPLLEPFDVVLTQEDFDWWRPLLDGLDFVQYHDRLRADVTHAFRSQMHPGPEAAGLDPATRPTLQVGDGLGLLSRFPIAGEQRIAWTGCFGGFDTSDRGAGDCLAMKGFSVATLELATGIEGVVYNLHGEAGATPEDQRLQAENYEQLATFIDEHSADRAVILGGDTNLHTDSDHPDAWDGADTEIWDDFLRRTGLEDSCTVLDCAERDAIDKIAYRSGADVTLVAVRHEFLAEDFVGTAGEPLSDHEPLAVEVSWRAANDS